MSPMLHGLRLRLVIVSNRTLLAGGHGEIGNRQTIGHQLILRYLGLVNE
jgi:hypothetical protein